MARNKYPEVTINRILDVASDIFLKKGYEKTTIQEIVDQLGDLSKGAIYHHFKSKEEIMDAVIDRFAMPITEYFTEIIASKQCTGLEKIRILLIESVKSPHQETMAKMLPHLLSRPRLLAKYMNLSINYIAPKLMLPLIQEGITDGSIQTAYPKELAEVFVLFTNIYFNPLIYSGSQEDYKRRVMIFTTILPILGLDILNDDLIHDMISVLQKY